MSIKLKIICLTALSCLVLLGVFMANILLQEKAVSSRVDKELDDIMLSSTKTVVLNVGSQLKTLNEVLLSEVKSGLKVSWNVMSQVGNPRLDYRNTVEWEAVNQYTKKIKKVRIPKMLVGQQWLGQNRSLAQTSPVVDEVKQLIGGTATIFQRVNEQGDMLRVCTNVEKLDKTRAIGTYIPATNPDGTANPVVKTLMSGQTFNGRAYVVNAWYLTTYEPIYDSNRKIIGALYYGIMQEKTEALRQGILNTELGDSGYIYVLDRKGHYVISEDGQRDGENVWNTMDSEGNYFIQSIINKAVKLKDGEVAYERYKFTSPGNNEDKQKVAAILYFEPWDWIIGAGAYEEDFKATKVKMKEAIANMVYYGAIVGGIATVLILFAAVFVSGRISNPIIELTKAVDDISQGNLDRTIDITSSDETGKLASSFKRMQSSLVILMKRAQK